MINAPVNVQAVTGGVEANTPRRAVMPRSIVRPADFRKKQVCIRLTERASSRLASIQGLVCAFGKHETLARLFEEVCIPALERYVAPYAESAKMVRLTEKVGAA